MRMKFPEKYIRHGKFVLHSGENSNIFYDVNTMLTEDFYLNYILDRIPKSEHYVGIATGGALLAIAAHVKYPDSKFFTIHNGELKRDYPLGPWILIDDVVTTGKSLLEAIAVVGSQPKEIIVMADRRDKNENPNVRTIFELLPLAA